MIEEVVPEKRWMYLPWPYTNFVLLLIRNESISEPYSESVSGSSMYIYTQSFDLFQCVYAVLQYWPAAWQNSTKIFLLSVHFNIWLHEMPKVYALRNDTILQDNVFTCICKVA